jgi:hypothetical protein
MIKDALELLIALLIYACIGVGGILLGCLVVVVVIATHKQITGKK